MSQTKQQTCCVNFVNFAVAIMILLQVGRRLSATAASVIINVERKKNELEGSCRMRSL